MKGKNLPFSIPVEMKTYNRRPAAQLKITPREGDCEREVLAYRKMNLDHKYSFDRRKGDSCVPLQLPTISFIGGICLQNGYLQLAKNLVKQIQKHET